jgi:tetratricopeptide (TPR) repeat protein
MLGLVADARATALAEQARTAPAGQADGLRTQARAHYRAAAEAYERAATKAPPGPAQGTWLLNCADRFVKAGLGDRAAGLLARLNQLDGTAPEENLIEAWYALGLELHRQKQFTAARDAYQRCLKPTSGRIYHARLHLALLDYAEDKFDPAEHGLQEVLTALRAAPRPDAELTAQAEFALAEVAFQRENRKDEADRDYATAEQRFLGALQQHPAAAGVPKARFCLGKCYWFVATRKSNALSSQELTLSPEERKHHQREMAESLRKALEQFTKVEELLQARRAAGGLTAGDATRLRLAEYAAAECHFFLGQYEEAVKRNAALADRYQGQPEELVALSQLWQCHNYLNQPDKAQEVVGRMRAALDRMPAESFNGSTPLHQREFWAKWLDEAGKPAAGGGQ